MNKILIILLTVAYSAAYSQSFFQKYIEEYGEVEFYSIRTDLSQQTSDSLNSVLEESPIRIYSINFMSEITDTEPNKDKLKYLTLLGYMSADILRQRKDLTESQYFYLAWLEEVNEDYISAIPNYTKALKKQFDEKSIPSNSLTYAGRAKCKFAVGDYYGAIKDFDSAIQFAPEEASYYVDRGRCRALTHSYPEAIKDFTIASEIKSDSYKAYYYRALTYIALNQKEKACLDFSQAGELGYKDVYEDIKKYCH